MPFCRSARGKIPYKENACKERMNNDITKMNDTCECGEGEIIKVKG